MTYKVSQSKHNINIVVEESTEHAHTWYLTLPDDTLTGVNDVFLHIDVACDKAYLHIAGELIADHFYNGEIWQVGLKKYKQRLKGNKLKLSLVPLKENADIYLDKWPSFRDGIAATLNSITVQSEYTFKM